MSFKLHAKDINQAYLQGSTELMRDIYLYPGKKSVLSLGEILIVMEHSMVSQSQDIDNIALCVIITFGICTFKNTVGYLSLHSKHILGCLVGLAGVYVDDTIQTGGQYFQ